MLNLMRRPVFLLTLTLAFGGLNIQGAPQAKAPEVISAKEVNAAPPAELQGRGVKRVRAVVLNTGMFANPRTPQSTSLSFFPGVTLVVNWTNVEKTDRPAGLIWTGKIQGTPGGQASLVISGKNVTANVNRSDGVGYQIRTTGDGRSWVREVLQSAFSRESEPVAPLGR
jgi:hypothetical protein